jgi:hypothetical protein
MIAFEVYDIDHGFYIEFTVPVSHKLIVWCLTNPNVRNIRSV